MPAKKRKSSLTRSKQRAAAALLLFTDLDPRSVARVVTLPEGQVRTIARLLQGEGS